LQDLNPTLLTTIQSEFDKVEGQSPPEPTRTSADNATATTSGPSGKKAAADPADELFPRVDIDKLVPSSVVSAINDTNWKNRKEALEQVQGILEANKRFKSSLGQFDFGEAGALKQLTRPFFSFPGDLATALKLRLADSNKVVQALALDAISRIASGMNKPFEKHVRMFTSPVAAVLADQKANIRAAGLVALTAMADACGVDVMVPSLATSLEQQNPALRKELLVWLEERFKDSTTIGSADLTPLAAPMLSCLEDRNADVRKGAQGVLPTVIAVAGYDYVIDKTSQLKPASRSTVIPLIDAAKSAAPSVASVAKATAAPAAKPPAARPPSSMKQPPKLGRPASRAATPIMPAEDGPSTAIAKPRVAAPRKSLARPSTTTQPAASSSATPPTREAPFRNSDSKGKQVRASKEQASMKWIVEGVARPEQVESLHQQMGPQVSAELLGLLFSKDHHAERDYLAALTLIVECASDASVSADRFDLSHDEMKARLTANADLIFKYVTIRLGDTSTTMTVKCLDTLDAVFAVLLDDGYRLSDYEASSLLPSLITKVSLKRWR
jgi:cytoskeleton-associated protein 5